MEGGKLFIHEYGNRIDELTKALGSESAVLCI